MNRETLGGGSIDLDEIWVEAKAIDLVLERIVALLADQYLSRRGLLAQELSLAECLTNERELRLSLS